MESPDLAVRRGVVVDALTACLERSKVSERLDVEALRPVLGSAPDLWRGGNELNLDPVWQLLIKQPGVQIEDAAPPLLLFKSFEAELGLTVTLPMALAALSQREEARLRGEVAFGRDDFVKTLAA